MENKQTLRTILLIVVGLTIGFIFGKISHSDIAFEVKDRGRIRKEIKTIPEEPAEEKPTEAKVAETKEPEAAEETPEPIADASEVKETKTKVAPPKPQTTTPPPKPQTPKPTVTKPAKPATTTPKPPVKETKPATTTKPSTPPNTTPKGGDAKPPTAQNTSSEVEKIMDVAAKNCDGKNLDVKQHLEAFASDIEARKIYYNSQDLSDCSGMFLRVCNSLKNKCNNYDFPDPAKVRDTRLLGRWFYERGNLKLIENAKANGNLIRPGAVMFYGHGNRKYTNLTIDKIAARDGIEHIGVVTAVDKDENGVVTGYTLFHGRSTGKIASRSTHHKLKPSRSNLPSYGNWNQQWLAVGYILTPKSGS